MHYREDESEMVTFCVTSISTAPYNELIAHDGSLIADAA